MSRLRHASRLGFLALLLAHPSLAARYALLIGAGQFPNAPGLHSLSGPPNDVEALRAELIRSWQIPAANVQVLLNGGAGRKDILAALDNLVKTAAAGDVVVIYYSGHGTSAHDRDTSGFGMGAATGAIVPADLKYSPGLDARSVLSQLIIGTNDLRPRLGQLDRKGVQALVLFDACYSGDTAKSIQRMVPRSADLLADIAAPGSLTAFNNSLKSADLAAEGWPYQNVVYISAATRYEVAWDISDALARSERPTVDGRAHGAFTNALLRGLQGAADTNHDGKITYAELHGFLVEQLQRNGQTPQLHPSDKAIVLQPILASQQAPPPAQPSAGVVPAKTALRIHLENADGLRKALGGMPNVQVADGAYDLAVKGPAPKYQLTHSGGSAVTPDPVSEEEALRLIGRRALAQRLLTLEFPRQDFNVEVSMTPDRGAYFGGDRITLDLKPERASWLLVADLDSESNVILIYPNRAGDARLVKAGEKVTAVQVAVEPPFGTDIVQIFAFSEKPEFYDKLVGSVRLDDGQVKSLIADLEKKAAAPGRSRAQRVTFTSKKQ